MDDLELVISPRHTWHHSVVLVPNAMELRFESNMSAVRLRSILSLSLPVLTRLLFTCTRATETTSALQQAPERPQNQAAVRPQDRLRAPPPHRQLLRARLGPRQNPRHPQREDGRGARVHAQGPLGRPEHLLPEAAGRLEGQRERRNSGYVSSFVRCMWRVHVRRARLLGGEVECGCGLKVQPTANFIGGQVFHGSIFATTYAFSSRAISVRSRQMSDCSEKRRGG